MSRAPRVLALLAAASLVASSAAAAVRRADSPARAALVVAEPSESPSPDPAPAPTPSPTPPPSPAPAASTARPSAAPSPSRSPRVVPDLGTGVCPAPGPGVIREPIEPLWGWRNQVASAAVVTDLVDLGEIPDEMGARFHRMRLRVVDQLRGRVSTTVRVWTDTAKQAVKEAAYSDRFLVAAGEWAEGEQLVDSLAAVHDDDRLAFAGVCGEVSTGMVRAFVAHRASVGDHRSERAVFTAVLTAPDGRTANQMQAFFYPPEPPPLTWYDVPWNQRYLDMETPPIPAELKSRLKSEWVALVVPDSWRAFPITLVTLVPDVGVNAGMPMHVAAPGHDVEMLSRHLPDEPLELWAFEADGAQGDLRQRIYSVAPAQHNGDEVRLEADPAITTLDELLRRARAGEPIFTQVPGNGLG